MRRRGARRAAAGRRGRIAWRCLVFCTAIFLGAACAGSLDRARPPSAFVSPSGAGASRPAGTRRRAVEEVQRGVEEVLGSARKTVNDVIEAPGRLSKQAQDTVDKTIESFKKDDGRVLDTDTPSGFVGAFTVSLAVLPYLPLSFYSTYLLATTGKGVPAGPQNLFGYAEGIATVVVFFFCFWSFVSLITRARGLPAGPFNLLGATQSFSWLAATLLSLTVLTNGGKTTPVLAGLKDGLKDFKLPPLPPISLPADIPKPSLPSGVNLPDFKLPDGPDLSKFSLPSSSELPKFSLPSAPNLPKFDGLSKLKQGLSDKLDSAKEQASGLKDKAKDAMKEVKEAVQPGKVKEPEAGTKDVEDLF